MHIRSLGRDGNLLVGILPTFFDFGNLLSLQRWRRDFSAKNDVANLALRQRRDVDVVLRRIIRQDQVFQSDFNLDPLLVGEIWPHVMR